MITNFEKQTQPLNDIEMAALPLIAACFRKSHVGKNKVVSNKQICDGMLKAYGIRLTPERVRKIINFIRINNMVNCLCSNSDGYYIATNESEIRDYIQSLRERAEAIAAVANAIDGQCDKVFRDTQTQFSFYGNIRS